MVNMGVNGITGNVASVQDSFVYKTNDDAVRASTAPKTGTSQVKGTETGASTGVVYERDTDTAAAKQAEQSKKTYKQDPELIARIKSAHQRTGKTVLYRNGNQSEGFLCRLTG